MKRMLSLLSIGVIMACSEQPDLPPSTQPVDTPMTVYSFSYPTSYLVDRLAGDAVDHSCILPAGEDAASWKPSTEVIVQLQKADLLFSNGLGFEGWVKTAALPSSKLVEAARTVEPIEMAGKTHSHGTGGAHSHGEIDSHAWSDPNTYAQMADVVAKALYTQRPDLTEQVKDNLTALKSELAALDARNDVLFADAGKYVFAANHPSYSYLMRSQNVKIKNFDFDPEGELDAHEVGKFESWAQGKDAIVLLWEATPLPEHNARFANTTHYTIDPLEAPASGTYDYVAQYKANQELFSQIIPQATKPADSEATQPEQP